MQDYAGIWVCDMQIGQAPFKTSVPVAGLLTWPQRAGPQTPRELAPVPKKTTTRESVSGASPRPARCDRPAWRRAGPGRDLHSWRVHVGSLPLHPHRASPSAWAVLVISRISDGLATIRMDCWSNCTKPGVDRHVHLKKGQKLALATSVCASGSSSILAILGISRHTFGSAEDSMVLRSRPFSLGSPVAAP